MYCTVIGVAHSGFVIVTRIKNIRGYQIIPNKKNIALTTEVVSADNEMGLTLILVTHLLSLHLCLNIDHLQKHANVQKLKEVYTKNVTLSLFLIN